MNGPFDPQLRRGEKKEVWLCGGVLLAVQLAYMLCWWNKGIQLNSNGLPTLAAQAILAGKIPYRDFHFWVPPGHLLIYTALTAVFGDGLIYVRAFALVERMAIFAIVYFWLVRVVSARAAFFGTFVAAVGFSSDVGDVIAHYGFDCVLASVTAGLTASVALTSRRRFARGLYFVTGILIGACMVFKQTQGVGMFLVFGVVFLVGDRSRDLRFKFRTVTEYLAGWSIPTGLVAWWLIRGGAWPAFLRQVFIQGPASKGTIIEILLRPILTMAFAPLLMSAFVVGAVLAGLYGLLFLVDRRAGNTTGESRGYGWPWWLWSVAFLAIAGGFVWSWSLRDAAIFGPLELILLLISAMWIFITLYGNALLAARYTCQAIAGRLDAVGLQKWILASVSAVSAYMFSLSWAAFEQMLLPGLALLLALMLDGEVRRGWRPKGFAVAGLALVLVCTATVRKLTWPYTWENWVDGPIKDENVVLEFPELRGLRVTRESAEFISKVTRIIVSHSRPDETILCFPNYALFYVLAHRSPGAFAYMHWFDIVSDDLAKQEADRIREHPPAVILLADLPEEVIRVKEISYRGGRRSSQRDMIDAIRSLPGYRVIDTLAIPQVKYPLKIYARE